jgi:hypothetical protein
MAEEKTIKRGKQSGYSSVTLWAKRGARRAEAEERQSRYDRLSTTDKVKLAKSRDGDSKRELARLEARLAKEKAPKPAPPTKEQREASKSAKAIKTAKAAASSVPNYT